MFYEDRERLKELKYRYIDALDAPNEDDFVDLFATDAVFEAGTYGRVEGRDGVREFIEYRAEDERDYHHMATNPRIAVDGDRAVGRWYYMILKVADDGSAEWGKGRYEDEFRKVDGEWVIQSLKAKREFTMQLPAEF